MDNENDFNGVQPDVNDLTFALRRGLGERAQNIIDSGVQPTRIHLAFALESGLEEIAQNIINNGEQPEAHHILYALRGGLGEIAENIYRNNEQIRPNLNLDILEVRNFVEHMKSKEQIGSFNTNTVNKFLSPLNSSGVSIVGLNHFRRRLPNKPKNNRRPTP